MMIPNITASTYNMQADKEIDELVTWANNNKLNCLTTFTPHIYNISKDKPG
ncbi:hypothetical protein ACFLX8_00150 [Chloroflexota bacterium]